MGEVGQPNNARISAPVPINSDHDLVAFDCGKPELNDWLKTKAIASEAKSSRTYVTCHDTRVVGYYCLAAGSVLREDVPSKIRHNLPKSVPVMVIGRLAIDHTFQGRKIGSDLLLDAMKKSIEISSHVGVRALLVHAIDDDAVSFYAKYGFAEFPLGTKTMFLPIEKLISALSPI